ncbi:hypothetical protein PIB30_020319 [Stylosanthes scabra]|uniref:Uncharacterized protein n=1 Tax=Stylosanthes scabra TaxID=79078 RepID=A0ABU6X6E2_9FABA|nr:hypothetical protein [Stylosanthes scabra]
MPPSRWRRERSRRREKNEERERDVVAAARRRAFFSRRSLGCHHPRSSPSQLQTSSLLEEPKRERKERCRGERRKEELSLLPSSSLSPPRLTAVAVRICRIIEHAWERERGASPELCCCGLRHIIEVQQVQ